MFENLFSKRFIPWNFKLPKVIYCKLTFSKYLLFHLREYSFFPLTLPNLIEISCFSHSMLQMPQFTHSFWFFTCDFFVFLNIFIVLTFFSTFMYILLNNDVRLTRIIITSVMTPHEESTIHKLGGPVPNVYIHVALFSVEVSRALYCNQTYAQCKVIHILKMN